MIDFKHIFPPKTYSRIVLCVVIFFYLLICYNGLWNMALYPTDANYAGTLRSFLDVCQILTPATLIAVSFGALSVLELVCTVTDNEWKTIMQMILWSLLTLLMNSFVAYLISTRFENNVILIWAILIVSSFVNIFWYVSSIILLKSSSRIKELAKKLEAETEEDAHSTNALTNTGEKTFITNTFTITEKDAYDIDALIRIKDHSGFFTLAMSQLYVLLNVASECEVNITHVGVEPDVIIAFSHQHFSHKDPADERYLYADLYRKALRESFYREVIRTGLLLEKLILLIDPKAVIEINYPEKEVIIGKSVSLYEDFMTECKNNLEMGKLSKFIPKELNGKVDAFLDLVIPQQNYQMGTCHLIWGMKKNIYRYGFKLDWKSPQETHPSIIFD